MIYLDGNSLSIADVVSVARHHTPVAISESGKAQVIASRAIVDKLMHEETPVYGISTGFGEFAKVFISQSDREKLQRNLILSHSTGVGALLPRDTVRAAMLLRANSLVKGYSGIRLSTIEQLLALLNKDVCPAVPSKGSVGASGDLAPLSHIALVMMGEGEVLGQDGQIINCAQAMQKAGISPIKLGGKEGLALINGTQIMTAVGALLCHDAEQLMKAADIAAALSLEALRGTRAAFDKRIAEVRPHLGQLASAKNILQLTAKSQIIESHEECDKVQDAYSLRCVSQVHGASKDALRRAKETILIEMNAVTDNPIIMPDTGEVISGGNFHGQPVALVMDYLKIGIAEIGSISERRTNRLVDPHLSALPAFLTAYPGVDSGFMITQYVAAALVSENKVLAHPASVDSIPTSANQEDHVSMGTISARQCVEMLGNVRNVLAIELLAAAQGIDFLAPLRPGNGVYCAWQYIRSKVSRMEEDRFIAPDIRQIEALICDESIVKAVEAVCGELAL